MTIARNRFGFDGEISFECDECGEELHTDTASFDTAKEMMLKEGWQIRKVDQQWHHYCSHECARGA